MQWSLFSNVEIESISEVLCIALNWRKKTGHHMRSKSTCISYGSESVIISDQLLDKRQWQKGTAQNAGKFSTKVLSLGWDNWSRFVHLGIFYRYCIPLVKRKLKIIFSSSDLRILFTIQFYPNLLSIVNIFTCILNRQPCGCDISNCCKYRFYCHNFSILDWEILDLGVFAIKPS